MGDGFWGFQGGSGECFDFIGQCIGRGNAVYQPDAKRLFSFNLGAAHQDQFGARRADERAHCLLYTSDAADD